MRDGLGNGALAGRRILVVEDEYMLADQLGTELERAGATVLGPVADVAGALAMLVDEPMDGPVDGAVLDINLGGEASYPVADELLRRGLPFLFTTGYDRQAIPDRYRQVALLQKPVEPAAVADAVGRMVRG